MTFVPKSKERYHNLQAMQLHKEIKQLSECIFFYRSLFTVYVLRLSIIIVNWEIFCLLDDNRLAHVHLSHHHVYLPLWFALSSFVAFCHLFVPSHPPLGTLKVLHSGKLSLCFYFLLRDQCDRCQGKVAHGRLPWLPPSFAFCPYSLANCLHCSQ